ncbi:hypothetical protein SLEP1_g52659 [Rubroshorea leprosula]|uniref:Phytocyanin domain-containing protein n=1 Tax=Rubroshorea leprosula TaxID=152421 RepID=A0AAV5M6Y9_9ROSI|nr:hypothetical protein SLEP1_g52659 [Rubroshorea leprosula]
MAARASITVAVLMFFFLMHGEADVTRYILGDDLGWTNIVSMETWPEGKTFYTGDILEFHYDQYSYDVAIVNQTGHDSCTVNEGAKVFKTGNDESRLCLERINASAAMLLTVLSA